MRPAGGLPPRDHGKRAGSDSAGPRVTSEARPVTNGVTNHSGSLNCRVTAILKFASSGVATPPCWIATSQPAAS
jgi:hypothetical protein